MPKAKQDHFDESNQVQSNWFKANVPQEDKIFGTLIGKRQIKSTLPGKEGEMVWVYDLKADYGSFHVLDEKKKLVEEPVEVNEGEFYSVGGKPMIDRQMTNVKIGQKIGFKFIEEQASKTKGFAASKVIKVYTPPNPDTGESPWMDVEYIDSLNPTNED